MDTIIINMLEHNILVDNHTPFDYTDKIQQAVTQVYHSCHYIPERIKIHNAHYNHYITVYNRPNTSENQVDYNGVQPIYLTSNVKWQFPQKGGENAISTYTTCEMSIQEIAKALL